MLGSHHHHKRVDINFMERLVGDIGNKENSVPSNPLTFPSCGIIVSICVLTLVSLGYFINLQNKIYIGIQNIQIVTPHSVK